MSPADKMLQKQVRELQRENAKRQQENDRQQQEIDRLKAAVSRYQLFHDAAIQTVFDWRSWMLDLAADRPDLAARVDTAFELDEYERVTVKFPFAFS